MRWKLGRRSTNIEDRRGIQISKKGKIGGIGTIVIVLAALYFGVDPSVILQQTDKISRPVRQQTEGKLTPEQNKLADFVSVVLADTEDVWHDQFTKTGGAYREPILVLFSDAVQSACGYAGSATGPFYCPADSKVYIDLSFYQDLKNKLNAPGDFAQAYVIAHEVGHHVQNLLGISSKVNKIKQGLSQRGANKLSVRQELQADCYAGVWAKNADKMRNILETGDIEEALNAASMIGDDRLQAQSKGHVTPDSFTHGSSAQRVKWFKVGFQSGDISQCDTFKHSL